MDVIISADTPLLTILLQGTPLVWYASYLSSGISARRGYQTRKTEKSLHKRSKNLQKFFNQQNLFCVLFSLTFKSPNKLQDEVTVNSSLGVKFPQSEQLERERERERDHNEHFSMQKSLWQRNCEKEAAFLGKKTQGFFFCFHLGHEWARPHTVARCNRNTQKDSCGHTRGNLKNIVKAIHFSAKQKDAKGLPRVGYKSDLVPSGFRFWIFRHWPPSRPGCWIHLRTQKQDQDKWWKDQSVHLLASSQDIHILIWSNFLHSTSNASQSLRGYIVKCLPRNQWYQFSPWSQIDVFEIYTLRVELWTERQYHHLLELIEMNIR